ncbi:MAG TPA: prolipoprotein diacylglyceryl transferase family protein [Chthonomonadaceae bacterium]|nr:prolipoprotein diacylglyceryl transferase family protein [Chthonomonadaceae bacterium]
MTLSAICYGAGYLTGLTAFWWMACRRRLATQGVLLLMLAGLIGGLASANLAQRLVAGTEGKTVLGAVAGGWLCVALCKRGLGIRRPLGDLFAVALSAGEAVGRWGCFFGGCCYGRPTGVPWAIWQHGAWRHPTQVYLSLAALAILIALVRTERRSLPENGLFYLQGLLYCAARFLIECWRESPPLALSLSAAQWACLAGLGFFAWKAQGLKQPARRLAAQPERSL